MSSGGCGASFAPSLQRFGSTSFPSSLALYQRLDISRIAIPKRFDKITSGGQAAESNARSGHKSAIKRLGHNSDEGKLAACGEDPKKMHVIGGAFLFSPSSLWKNMGQQTQQTDSLFSEGLGVKKGTQLKSPVKPMSQFWGGLTFKFWKVTQGGIMWEHTVDWNLTGVPSLKLM